MTPLTCGYSMHTDDEPPVYHGPVGGEPHCGFVAVQVVVIGWPEPGGVDKARDGEGLIGLTRAVIEGARVDHDFVITTLSLDFFI